MKVTPTRGVGFIDGLGVGCAVGLTVGIPDGLGEGFNEVGDTVGVGVLTAMGAGVAWPERGGHSGVLIPTTSSKSSPICSSVGKSETAPTGKYVGQGEGNIVGGSFALKTSYSEGRPVG